MPAGVSGRVSVLPADAMPLYHSIVTTTALMQPRDLTALFRRLAKEVNANGERLVITIVEAHAARSFFCCSAGGVVRSCENYGLKALPHRIRSPHVSAGGENRYHYVARKVGMYYDCSANVLPVVEHMLRLNQGVSRSRSSCVDKSPALRCYGSRPCDRRRKWTE